MKGARPGARDRAIFVPVAQPIRALFVGTLLVLLGSVVAIVGVVRGEPVLFVVGLVVLAAIFMNEVLARLWLAPLDVPRRWWSQRPSLMKRDRWLAEHRARQALIEPLIAGADFRSWKAFYDGDARRRGKEVALGELADGEFCWRIIWFPTTEVVVWPFRWQDERRHRALYGQVGQRTRPSDVTIGPAALPEMIYVIGRVESADEGRQRVASASTLDKVRCTLAAK